MLNDLDRLLATDAIRKVKATYCYSLDVKDWVLLRSVFTDDAVIDMRSERDFSLGKPLQKLGPIEQAIADGDAAVLTGGGDALVQAISQIITKWVTVHHLAAPIIDVTDATRATGIWPIFDFIDDGKNAARGYGHYHEQYEKIGDLWLIKVMQLTRTRIDGRHPLASDESSPAA